MPVYRVELRSSRRELRHEDRVIFNIKNAAELAGVLADMAKRAGVKPEGHKIRVIDTTGRRWKTVREVAG